MRRPLVLLATAMAVATAGCATTPSAPVVTAPAAVNAPPAPGISPGDLVGRWGFASYHKEADRTRTVTQARGHCNQPYTIGRGPAGGALMHLADQKEAVELYTKAGADGRRYLGPEGPAPGDDDREIVSFDGRVLTLRWMNPEIAGRYGISVYVRCSPRAA
jgi:hypothetical protein